MSSSPFAHPGSLRLRFKSVRPRSLTLLCATLVGCAGGSPPSTNATPTIASGTESSSPAMPTVTGEEKFVQGIRYIDIAIGTGEIARPRQCVYTHYTAWLTDGRKVESSRDPRPNGSTSYPLSFPLGAQLVIAGWDIGFQNMRVGGKRRLFVPHRLGYGENGNPPAIPPRAALIFDIELLALAPTATTRGRQQSCPPWESVGRFN